jgi:hypothetical protein
VVSDRGQAFTLEAVTAAILVLAAIGFALQMTAVTPLSASTSSQHVENQLQATSEGVLGSAEKSGALREAVLYWNSTEEQFHESGLEPFYRSGAPPNEFGDTLERVFGNRSVAYNVFIHYQTDDGIKTQEMVRQGQPSDHAVSASRTIELTDEDRLVGENFSLGPSLGNLAADEFYVEQRDADGIHYNLVRIEVVAWRI